MRNVPNFIVDKEELSIKCNNHHRVFDSYLSTLSAGPGVCSHLDVLSNIMESSFFNETYYDMTMVFVSNLGFEPTLSNVRKLTRIFPNHKLLKMVTLDGN